MNLNLAEALRTIDRDQVFRIASEARPPSDYFWASVLPEVPRFDFQAKSGAMTVRSTMVGPIAMDAPYNRGGQVVISKFSEKTAKFGNTVDFPEEQLRELHEFVREIRDTNGNTRQAIVDTALNFVDKLLVQPHLDTMEYLRGLALATGVIDWTFEGVRLNIDYGIPARNKNAQRTGNDRYAGSTSKFWDDVLFLRRRLGSDLVAIVAHPVTIMEARYNPVNSMVVTAESSTAITFRKVVGNTQQFTADVADTVTILLYGKEAEILDPNAPSQTIKLPFMPKGLMLGIGKANTNRLLIGAGSTEVPQGALGYTHIAPTSEGDFARGRWTRVYTPQDKPWMMAADAVTNGLPVIENPNLLAICSTVLDNTMYGPGDYI